MATSIPAVVSKGINRFIFRSQERYKPVFTRFMHTDRMDSNSIDVVGLVGYNLPTFRMPGEGVKQMSMAQGFTKRYVASIYSGLDSLPMEDLETDLYNLLHSEIVSKGAAMSHAFNIQRERAVAAFWSNIGFASTSPFTADGLGLFNTAHPIAPNTTATGANRPSQGVSLSVTAWKNMYTNLQTQLMPDNVTYMMGEPRVLVVHPSQRNIAYQITKQMYEPNSADRNINVARLDNVEVVHWPYFQLNGTVGATLNPLPYNGWFVVGDRHFAHFYTRSPFRVKIDTDIRINSLLVFAQAQYTMGADDWRGLYGSPGQ